MLEIKFVSKKTVQKIGIIALIIVIVGGSLTFAMTWRNMGFSKGFVVSWLSSFAFCVMFIAPVGGVISLLVNKVLNSLLARVNKIARNITFGLCMAVIMESIMAIVTTMNLHGFVETRQFLRYWMVSMTALPIGIIFSIVITLIVKPKLEAFWVK